MFRLALLVIAGAARLVPEYRRDEWREEWEAEVWYGWPRCGNGTSSGLVQQWRLLRAALGAYRHASGCSSRELSPARLGAALAGAADEVRARPARSVAAIAVAGLALGAGGLAFTVAGGARAGAAPYPGDGRAVRVFNSAPAADIDRTGLSTFELTRFRADNRSLEALAGFRRAYFRAEAHGMERMVRGAMVTPDWFRAVGVEPRGVAGVGGFETAGDSGAVAVVREDLWLEWPGTAEPRSITLNGKPFTVVGVVPASFHYPAPESKIWIPLRLADFSTRVGDRAIGSVGRLREGVSATEAQDDLARLSWTLQTEHPEGYLGAYGVGWSVEVVPVGAVPRDQLPLLALLFGAGGLLTVGGGAAAAMLTARRTTGLTAAMGSALIAGTAILVAAGLLASGLYLLSGTAGSWLPDDSVALAGRAAAYLAMSGALVFGLRQLARCRRRESLLVACSAVLVIVLLGGTATVGGAYRHMVESALGYDPAGLVAFRSLTGPLDPAVAKRAMLVSGISGATVASTSQALELTPSTTFELDGRHPPGSGPPPGADVLTVGTGYFGMMGIPILTGRDFTAASAAEVIVNRTLAERFWPGGSALGRRLLVHGSNGPPTPWLTVVGVAADVRHQGVSARPVAEIYLPAGIGQQTLLTLLVRTALPPDRVLSTLRQEGVLPRDGFAAPTAVGAAAQDALAPYRVGGLLLAAVALVSALVAAVAAAMAQRRAALEGLCLGGLIGGAVVCLGAPSVGELLGGSVASPIGLGAAAAGIALTILLPAVLLRSRPATAG